MLAISRATATFCWLPPDSELASVSGSPPRTSYSLRSARARSFMWPRRQQPVARDRRRAVLAQGEVLGQREVEHEAAQLAVLGDVATPASHGRAHAAPVTSLPADGDRARTRRRAARRSPRTSSRWPLPSTPASATISPPRTVSDTPRTASQAAVVAHAQVLDLEHRLAELGRPLVDAQQHVAADHQAREALLGRALGRHRVDLLAAPQHGDAVGDLEHLVRACGVMKTIAMPSSFSARSTSNSSCVSWAVSTAVGSSRTRMRASR